MSDGIYAALSGAIASERSLDVVANNVANVGTDGFRGERLAFRETMARAQGGGTQPTTLRYTEIEESRLDMTQGPLRETGNPLDLAIGGDAFFAVQTPQGERYTRAGSFVVGADGGVTTHEGFPVLADGPRDRPRPQLVVPQGTSSLSVASDGTLSTEGTVLGRIGMVHFQHPAEVISAGGAYYSARQGVDPTRVTDGTVVQGFIEGANVGPISGMNELITASRTFEAFQRVIHTFQTLDERTARDLAKV